MNKLRYRIIFNKVRNMLIAVADIAGTGRGTTASRAVHLTPVIPSETISVRFSLSLLSFVVLCSCCLASMPVQARSIIHRDTSAPGRQQPNIRTTANGLPQVDIQTPGSGGVSVNKYSQFDVDSRGVILNNSHNPVSTLQGGWVTGNPSLARGEARVIVNEINSRNPSQLNGYVEVAGKRAQIVMANPSGITCNGCGFINANKATLTTGQVQMQNERIAGYDISRGEVVVQGKGMDARGATSTEIFARAVKLNAEIQAGELTVVTGQNTITTQEGNALSAGSVTATPKTNDGTAKPQFALDSSALGGMYANKITFIGTEKGMGVNMEGDVASMPGDIILTADGTIQNKGNVSATGTVNITSVHGNIVNDGKLEAQQTLSVTASGQIRNTASGYVTADHDIHMDAGSGVENNGRTYAAGSVRVHTPGTITHNGSLVTGGNMALAAGTLEAGHDSLLAAGADRQGNRTGNSQLTLSVTGELSDHGNISVTGNAVLQGASVALDNATTVARNTSVKATTGKLSAAGSQIQADDTLALSSPSAIISDHARVQARELQLQTPVLSATDGTLIQTGPDDLRLNISRKVNLDGGTLATHSRNLMFTTSVLNATGSTLLHSGSGRFQLDVGTFSGGHSDIRSNGELVLNSHYTRLGGASLTADSLSLSADSLDISQGELRQTGNGSLNINASGAVDYTAGSVLSAGRLRLQADSLTGTEGTLAAMTDMAITSHHLLNQNGTIQTGSNFSLSTRGLDNTDGVITAGQNITLFDSAPMTNARGKIASGEGMNLSAADLDNAAGLVQSGRDMVLDTRGGTLTNRDSGKAGIISLGNLTLRTGTLDNTDGWLSSSGWLNATTGDMNNTRGTFGTQKALTLSTRSLTSISGLLYGGTGLTLATPGMLINTHSDSNGGIISQGDLSISSGDVDNTGGLIQSAGDMSVNTGTSVLTNNDSGNNSGMLSGGRLTLTTAMLNNRGGALTGGTDVSITAGSTDNRNGILGSQSGGLSLSVNDMDNVGGLVQAQNDIHIDTHHQTLNNTGSRILSGGNITLESGALDNTRGLIRSLKDTLINTGTAALINQDSGSDGGILGGGRLTLDTGELDNRNGTLAGQANTTVTSGLTDNQGGLLASYNGSLTLNISGLHNDGGRVQSGNNLLADTKGKRIGNAGGTLFSKGILTLNSGELDNTAGQIVAEESLGINTHGQHLVNRDSADNGGIISGGTLTLNAGETDNQHGHIAGRADTTVNTAGLDNRKGILVSDTGMLSILAKNTLNQAGLLQAGTNLTLNTQGTGLDNTVSGSSGGIRSGGTLTIDSGLLDNSSGLIWSAQDMALDTHGQVLTSINSGKDGGIISKGTLTLNSGELNNSAGRIQAATLLRLDTHGQNITNAGTADSGGILSRGELTLKGGRLNNTRGTIAASGAAGLTVQDTDNTDGHILADQSLSLVSGAVNNLRGLLQSAGLLTLDTQHHTLINAQSGKAGGIIAGGDLHINSGQFDSDHGVLTGENVSISTGGEMFSHRNSHLDANGSVSLRTGQLDNHAGRIRARGALDADTHRQKLINTDSGTEGGIFSAGHLTLTTGELDNQSGILLSQQSASLSASRIDNRNGTLAGLNDTLTIKGGETQNAGGLIQSAGDLWLDTQNALLNNSEQGNIRSGGNLTLRSGELNNQDGLISGQGLVRLDAGNISNARGSVTSDRSLNLTSLTLTNPGGLIRADDDLTINTQGQLLTNTGSGTSGGLVSLASMTLNTGDLHNQTGFIAAGGVASLTARTISNQSGLVAGNGGLTINSHALENTQGTLQSAVDLAADTHGQIFTNTQGLVSGARNTRITSGSLDNTSGTVQGGTGLTLVTGTGTIDNPLGKLLSAGTLTLQGGVLDNSSGEMQSAGNATLTLMHLLDNSAGLLRGGQALNITAPVLVNKNTRGPDKGTEAQLLTIQADRLDNTQGALRAAILLEADIRSALDNTNGLVSSEGKLNVHDNSPAPSLTLNNEDGTLIAGTEGALQAASLQGKGQVLSQGNLSISLTTSLNNTGSLSADGNLLLDDAQNVSNYGNITAGRSLTLRAQNISNQTDGTISANNMDISAPGALNNIGLIDGGLTRLTAATLNNTGTGRIYGDHLVLQAGTLNNHKTVDSAPVIAARERLDIGAGTLSNTDHALIYSGGDMSIGGHPDSLNHATGEGMRLENHSAQIEASGNLTLYMQAVDNRDIHLALSPQPVDVSREHHHEFQLDGGQPHYDAGDPRINADTGGRVHRLSTPEGSSKDFNEFYYDRVTAETQVIHKDPAEILSGSALHWQGNMLTNQDSRIVAGGDLTAVGAVDNHESQGERRVTDTDQGTPWAGTGSRRHKKPGKRRTGGKKSSKVKTSAYGPFVTTTTLPLHLMRYEGNTTPAESSPAMTTGSPVSVSLIPTPVSTPSSVLAPADIHLTADTHALRSFTLPGSDRTTAIMSADQQMKDAGKTLAALSKASGLALSPVVPKMVLSSMTTAQRVRPLTLPAGQHFTLSLPPSDRHDAAEIRVTTPDIHLPDNSLFTVHPEAPSHWLVETDPRFTQKKQWLGTGYMQQALATSPDRIIKRIGDGYYEQKLLREQVISLTGERYLQGFSNDEEQFRTLMNNGITFARQYPVTPGVALSPEQMALLTSDMVWLVNETVTLPDGTQQTVQVPQLYVRARPGDLSGDGTLLAGRSLTISSPGSVTNSGLISGRDVTKVTSTTLNNRGDIQGDRVDLQARQNISNTGGRVIAGSALSLLAGHDISSETTLRSDSVNTWKDRTAGIYVQSPGGSMVLQALGNITLTASELENTGAGGTTRLLAGQDLKLNTLTTARTENHDWGRHEYLHQSGQTDTGSRLTTQGDLMLGAGRDVRATAADISAGGVLSVGAGRDIRLGTGVATRDIAENSRQSSGGFLSKSTTETHDEIHDRQAISTTLSGDSVRLQAGRNISVHGSNVAGTQDVSLVAGNNLDITTAGESHQESHLKKEKKSGLMGSGGIGFTIGSSSQKSTTEGQGETQLGSTLGSQKGNLTLSAGHDTTVHGSDLVAGGDIALSGQNVNITAAENSQSTLQKFESHQSGLTVALSGAAGAALNTAVENVQQARRPQDTRLQALGGVKAALSGVQAAQALELNNAQQAAQQAGSGEVAPAAFGVTASLGSQSSKSEQKTRSYMVSGSSLNAGHDIHIAAAGDGQGHGGDITVQGSQVKAAHDIYLDAQQDIQLLSALNTDTLSGKNSSHGGSVGVGISVGQNTGITVSASVNTAKGHEYGTTLTHTDTTFDAGNHITLNAGRDAMLRGAQVSGEKITADVKRNLTLQSEQDSDDYDSKQQNASAGASFTYGSMSGSASVSLSQDKIHSNFDSVKDQTGLFAGKEGFDVTTGQHTQLDGAVIASTADKTKNRLDTGTLGFSDIHNQADFSAQHQGVSAGTGGAIGSQLMTNMAMNTLSGVNKSGHDSSTTHAAVSDGGLTIRNTADQKQDISALSRDTDHAANGLSPIFDKEKVQRQLQQAQMVSDISSQVLDIYNTNEAISATQKATENMQNTATRQNAMTLAEKELKAEKDKHPSVTVDEETITKRAYQNLYNKALEKSEARLGDPTRQAVTASVAVLSGLAGGDIKAALANGAAPYLATRLKQITGQDNPSDEQMAVRLLGHAIIGGVVAELNGSPAAGGATGAVTGEVAAMTISKMYFGKPPSELNESEREQLSGMSTIAAALAGSLASDSAAGTIAGAQSGKNAVENNLLGGGTEDGQIKAARDHAENVMSCADDPGSESCHKGQALQKAMIVALPAGLGGGVLIAATPELAAAAQVAIRACAGNIVLCLNNAGIMTSEAIVPGGVGAGGAIGIGKTAAEATAAKAETVAANATKNNPSWKAGEYLDDFKTSSTPLELIREQAGKGSQTAYIRMDHILKGEVKTLKDGTKVGSGGHYIRDPNIKIDKVTGAPDANGVSTGYISVRDPATGQWVNKKAETTFFPEQWSKRQTAQEIESAFKNSERIPNTEMWSGKSSSGVKIQGYYGKPDGTGATAWPVYTGRNK
ncbi:filamentous hemagglutinin N-terminal domain-containing protein [Salmonella enterica subsp. enterica serovar Oslo]|nr:filamentous hemagglutinin N-terminal domain-containing protein [Salmonella enterica subsp. enterica serovar Oslo]